MKITIDAPTIVNATLANEHGGGARMWVEFDAEPKAGLGQTYRTFVVFTDRISASADHGCFRVLWQDGKRLLVYCIDGWTPANGHGILP